MRENGTMMQCFEWDMPSGILWRKVRDSAAELAELGITALWLPPPCKGSDGIHDRGYGLYDLYDLGEFDQKGTVPTKYGSRREYIEAIHSAHAHGIEVYADIVFDHMMGADGLETVIAEEHAEENRCEKLGAPREMDAWTHYFFPGRAGAYSDFEWHWYHFTGIDHDARTQSSGIFKFCGKQWERQVDRENCNFEYLMGASLDLSHPEVKEQLLRWGLWFVRETGVDGFRLDAVKHIRFDFYRDWLHALRMEFGREFFSVGEYWQQDLEALRHYISSTDGSMALFDVPLHFRFYEAAKCGSGYDMRRIFDGTLTQDMPTLSVTFVDNHDSQPGSSLESWVEAWFRPLAYALILLRKDGYPCVFYGDLYGMGHEGAHAMREELVPLLRARALYSYGPQHDFFDHPNTIGWTREGDAKHEDSGLAVLMTNGSAGEKTMYVGRHFAGAEFYDLTGHVREHVRIGEDGQGEFRVQDGSVSVWVKVRRD